MCSDDMYMVGVNTFYVFARLEFKLGLQASLYALNTNFLVSSYKNFLHTDFGQK